MAEAKWGGVHHALFNGNGLAKRLLVAVVAFSTLVTTVITGVELYGDYRHDLGEIDATFRLIGSSNVPSLEHSVWQLDDDAVRTQLEGLLRLPDIAFAAVDIDGRARWSVGQVVPAHRREVAIELTHKQGERSTNIGTLRVVANIDRVIGRVWSRALIELLGNGVKTSIVALFLMLVFQYLVTQHLTKVARFVRDIDPLRGVPGDQVLVLDRRARSRRRPDVLDAVVGAINGLLKSLVQAHEDISASHAQLAESELRFRLGIEAAEYGLWDCDLVNNRVFASPECARIVGLEPADLSPEFSAWLARIHPDDVQSAANGLRAHLSGDTSLLRLEMRLQHESLGWRWVVLRGRIVARDTQGAPLRALGTLVDFTELKQAREALREANLQLESRILERTVALEAARDEAERANRAKSEFLSRMSHELRTPLNGILGFSQILQRDAPLSEKQARGMRIIEESGRHLMALIDDILDLARIDAAKLELNPTEVNFPAFLHVIGEIVRVKAEEKDLLVVCQAASDLPAAIRVDEKRLRQVLLNLLSNAIKFTDAGDVRLRVTRVKSSVIGMTVRLRFDVEDNGIGMSEEQLGRLFLPFAQVAEANRRVGGTGLGLVISQQLVRQMGGEIHVRSRPGEGSIFSFEIEVTELKKQIPVPPDLGTPIGYEGARRKILVVDDVPQDRAVLLDSLGALGFEMSEASDGEEAIVMAARLRPDLIVMDLLMPVMDGFEAISRLRRVPEGSTVPIIATSLSATAETQARTREVGANALVDKRSESFVLLDAIAASLDLTWIREGPLAGMEDARQRSADLAVAMGATTASALSGARILLVEDNAINREIAQHMLSRAGIVVTVACDGQEALDILHRQRFDGVLMDCLMPVMDGYATTRALRQQPQLRSLPVIAMTANAMVEDRDRAIAAGMNDFISKPINVELMFTVLARWVRPGVTVESESPGLSNVDPAADS